MKQVSLFLPPEIKALYRDWIDREIAAAGERVSDVINKSADQKLAGLRSSFRFARRSFGQRMRYIKEKSSDSNR